MRYILKRLVVLVVTLFIISALSFIAFQLIPGDPVTKMLGVEATPERIAQLRELLGLDRSVMVRYFEWLSGFVTGDFGLSYSYSTPVSQLLGDKVITTSTLSAMAFALVVLISIPAGFLLARLSDIRSKGKGAAARRALATLAGAVNQIIMSIPPFFAGIILTYIFGLVLRLFTPGAFVSYSSGAGGFLLYLLFPALAIALPRSAMVVKLLRGSIQGELQGDYVRTAYSRGGSRFYVLIRHVARNAILPVVTFLAMTLADIVAGSIIIEQVFAIPGTGRLLLLSISNRDYPVVQAIVVFIASLVVVVNFLADLAYQYIDPRIRLG
ncbi:MAG: ABC transporter permease [Oscillospiraceae bacterium]|nr:ABC transporter permease [Oscillospiraceae bacterium]